MRIHIVQKGDTLWKIAQKYGVNFEELKKLNSHLSNPELIMPGMKIKIPVKSTTMKQKEVQIPMHQQKEKQQLKEQQVIQQKHKETGHKKQAKEQQKVKHEIPTVPYKPVVPKVPQIPGIDVSNYYMVNMANMSLQQAQQQQPQQVVTPQPLPQPMLMPQQLPKLEQKEEKVEKHVESPPVQEKKEEYIKKQEGVYQPMIQYCPTCCSPITPVMPGTGFNFPAAQPNQQIPFIPQQIPQFQQVPAQMMTGAEGGVQFGEQTSVQINEKDCQQNEAMVADQGDFEQELFVGMQPNVTQQMGLHQPNINQHEMYQQDMLAQQMVQQQQWPQGFDVGHGCSPMGVPQTQHQLTSQQGYHPGVMPQGNHHEHVMMPMGAHQGGYFPQMPYMMHRDDEEDEW